MVKTREMHPGPPAGEHTCPFKLVHLFGSYCLIAPEGSSDLAKRRFRMSNFAAQREAIFAFVFRFRSK
jgi:hypothetical protein